MTILDDPRVVVTPVNEISPVEYLHVCRVRVYTYVQFYADFTTNVKHDASPHSDKIKGFYHRQSEPVEKNRRVRISRTYPRNSNLLYVLRKIATPTFTGVTALIASCP